eukprot:12360545-Alexandrium_andersonii.AAC.1
MESERQRRATAARFRGFLARATPRVRDGNFGGGHTKRLVMAVALPSGSLQRVWSCDGCHRQGARVGPFKRARCGGRANLQSR